LDFWAQPCYWLLYFLGTFGLIQLIAGCPKSFGTLVMFNELASLESLAFSIDVIVLAQWGGAD
jgi:hypothetical protein